jgi:hypothetical protein
MSQQLQFALPFSLALSWQQVDGQRKRVLKAEQDGLAALAVMAAQWLAAYWDEG